jgi:WD40 repeat protein
MNYFNTIDLYSMKNGAMLRRYIGHDAGITAYCYSSVLKLLVTGSSDNNNQSVFKLS